MPSVPLLFLISYFYLKLSSYPFTLYFLLIHSPTNSFTHTHSHFQPPLIHPLSNSFTSLPVNLSVLTLLWSSTYPPVWLTCIATGAFWPLSAFLIRQSSFGYCTRTEFKLGLARLWREAPRPFINPQLPCCGLGWPM